VNKRFILLVLDGVGAGELPDAADFGDVGASTLGNLARTQDLHLPHLQALGLGNLMPLRGLPEQRISLASYGRMAEKSQGKDSTLGHWELTGLITEKALPTYPKGFPAELLDAFTRAAQLPGLLGNCVASGTDIIRDLGAEHVHTKKPILYTSADSVFQIAAHEAVIPIERQYEICQIARDLLVEEHAVARVIARPFIGKQGSFERTVNRRDFSLEPRGETALSRCQKAGVEVVAIGKIRDLFAGVGIDRHLPSKSNAQGCDQLIRLLNEVPDRDQLILLNLVDFDMLWGHRCDPVGFKGGLEAFDQRLPEILISLAAKDLLVMTADHGNDPTGTSTDHTREYVPLLALRPGFQGVDLGTRESFCDMSATLLDWFQVEALPNGLSFLPEILTANVLNWPLHPTFNT
jgi:phosphopentomutase